MKKLFAFLLIVFCYTQHVCSQSLHIDSTRFITGNKCCTHIEHAIPTSDKGILFAGQAIHIPGGVIPYFPLDTVLTNVMIGKIDSNQQISWIKVYGGSDDDRAVAACETPDGGYAVLANTGSSNGDVTGFKGVADIWLLRLTSTGDTLWTKTYGSTMQDIPISIASTPDHGFIIFGVSNGSDIDVPFHYGSMWTFDWVVIKTDSAGNVQWSKNIGTSYDEGRSGAILSVDSGYYFIAGAESKDLDCVDTAWHSGVNTGADIYLFRLDAGGNILWNKSYGGSSGENAACAMYDTRDSTIVVSGFTGSNNYMVTGYIGSAGYADIWVLKLSKSGTLVWQKTLGTTNDDKGAGICASHDGGYMVSGSTRFVIGGTDCWIFRLDTDGSLVANKIFGGTANDNPNSIVPYLDGYVVAGTSGSSVFTEGTCNENYSGAFVSYLGYSPLGINPANSANKTILSAYPNPVRDRISIQTEDKDHGELTIINSTGQVIYKQQVKHGASTVTIDASVWASGLYCIRWQGESGAGAAMKIMKH